MYINNPQSSKLIPKQKAFLFRPLQDNQQLIKTVLICSDSRVRNYIFWEIQQFYDWLQSSQYQYKQELIAKQFTNINTQALFLYFLFNIEIEVSEDKLSVEVYFPTDSKYSTKHQEKKYISEQLIQELQIIFCCKFDKNKTQLEMVSSAIYKSLLTLQNNFLQYYQIKKLIIKVKIKCIPVKHGCELVLQQNGDIIKSKFNSHRTITLSQSETFHNQKPFFSTQKLFTSLDRIRSLAYLNLNFDLQGYAQVYSEKQIMYEGVFQDGFLEGYGKIYNRETLIYEGTFTDNMLHGQGRILYKYGYMYGTFKNDMMHGQFMVNSEIHFFERDIEVRRLSSEIQIIQDVSGIRNLPINNSIVAQKQVCTYKDFYVHTQGYRTFHPGKWIFETMVDYFIEYFYNQQHGPFKPQFYNTSKTNDFLNQKIRIDASSRLVFAHNYNNSHFLLFIVDKGSLYVCDSLYCSRPDLEQRFCQLLGLRGNTIKLNCTQQQNGYDCGIFASYYALKFMNPLPIQEIQLQVNNIEEVRWQLCQLIKNNHNYQLTFEFKK